MSVRTLTLLVAIALLMIPISSTYATTNSTNVSVGAVAVNLTAELNNSRNAGYNFTVNEFAADTSSQCSLSLITPCNNNVPSQFVCINSTYSEIYAAQSNQIYSNFTFGRHVCPLFLLAGLVSCGTQDGYCVVRDTPRSPPVLNNTNKTTATYDSTTIAYASTSSYSSTIVYTSTMHYNATSSNFITNLINQIIQFFKGIFGKL